MDESKKLCAYLLEKAIAELPEGSETILGIFDLRGFGHRNADFGFVRFLVGVLDILRFFGVAALECGTMVAAVDANCRLQELLMS